MFQPVLFVAYLIILCSSNYIALNDRMFISNEVEWMWKQAAMAYLSYPSI
jgi:uncharacterized membrane protein YkvI